MRRLSVFGLCLLAATLARALPPVPEDFPRFTVPGHEEETASLRELFWLHYPGATPKSTMWDEWLSLSSLWPAVESQGWSDHMRRAWRRVLSERVGSPPG